MSIFRSPMDRRADRRRRTNLRASAVFGAHVIPCTVLDVSTSGAQLSPVNRYPLPDRFVLRIPSERFRELVHVVWREDGSVGVAFIS